MEILIAGRQNEVSKTSPLRLAHVVAKPNLMPARFMGREAVIGFTLIDGWIDWQSPPPDVLSCHSTAVAIFYGLRKLCIQGSSG